MYRETNCKSMSAVKRANLKQVQRKQDGHTARRPKNQHEFHCHLPALVETFASGNPCSIQLGYCLETLFWSFANFTAVICGLKNLNIRGHLSSAISLPVVKSHSRVSWSQLLSRFVEILYRPGHLKQVQNNGLNQFQSSQNQYLHVAHYEHCQEGI